MTDNMLIDRLAQQVLHWGIGADRFMTGDRSWIPKWKFNPLEHLEDAFRLLDHSLAVRYSISQSGGSFAVEVEQGRKTGRATGISKPRTITLALARSLGLEVYRSRLENHILPRWRDVRIGVMRSKEILEWLQAECTSWHMMVDLRNIMSGIFTKAQEWELLPETFANPMSRVKIGRKWMVRPERILSEQETVEVLGHLDDPHRLVCETCLSTGARISEVLGLQLKHLNPEKGTILVEQRHCRGDIDVPKTKNSRRVLTLGTLVSRYETWISKKTITSPEQWLFPQDDDPCKPMWDSGVRKALKIAATAAGCDFSGFGLHSLRRANITWRQEVGASAIEASKIAGHGSVNMTNDYTHVQLKRQEELTRAIQDRLGEAALKRKSTSANSAVSPNGTLPIVPVSHENLGRARLTSASFSTVD